MAANFPGQWTKTGFTLETTSWPAAAEVSSFGFDILPKVGGWWWVVFAFGLDRESRVLISCNAVNS